MSYDMSLGDEYFNHTYNTSKMWYAHNEKGIRLHYGMTGKEAVKPLRELRNFMEENEADLTPMNPENGWGSYQTALEFVNRMIGASMRNPDEIWEGD